jgi:hypothetical protein
VPAFGGGEVIPRSGGVRGGGDTAIGGGATAFGGGDVTLRSGGVRAGGEGGGLHEVKDAATLSKVAHAQLIQRS